MNNVVKLTKSAKDSDLGLLREELKKGADINCEGSFLLLNSVIFAIITQKSEQFPVIFQSGKCSDYYLNGACHH